MDISNLGYKKENMEKAFFTLVLCISFVQSSIGLSALTCDDVDPILSSTVKCSCRNNGAPGINWYRGNVFLTQCTLLSGKCFNSIGYTFTVDITASTYTIEFGSYNYTECTNVACSDSTDTSDSDFQRISVNDSSYKPTIAVYDEPVSNHMNGKIVFTTDCIYKANSSHINVTAKWKAVVNETEADDLDIDETISKTGSCQYCTYDFASKYLVSLIHQEEKSESRIKAKIRLRLFIDGVPYTETTRNEYFVKVRSGPTSKSSCCFDEIWCIIIIIVVVLAISYIPAVVIRCNEQCSNKVIKGCNLCILIIPCVGLILIIIYCCKFCKGYRRKNKVKPSTPIRFTCDESSVTMTSFKVLWTSASSGETGLKFLLVWSTGNEKKKKYIPYGNNNDMEYVIRDLIKETTYNVKICAEIKGVRSEFTENLTVTTLDKPRTPIKFTYDKSSLTINSFKVRWEPAPNGESGLKFLLVWSTDNEKKKKYIPYKVLVNSYIEHDIQNLKEATKYKVKICAEVDNVKSEFTKPLTVETLEGMLTKCKKKHQRIAGEDEICCENCKETRGAHASHALCLSHRLYLCLRCFEKEHKNETCVLLWNTGDIEGKDHKLCCKNKYNYDDLQLKGAFQAENSQTDSLFICSQCIKKDKYVNSTSHQQLHGPLNTRVLMCCKENETTGGKETVNFCIQCKTFVCACASCLIKHEKHLLISSLKSDMDIKPSLCCELNEKTRGIETDFCIQCNTFICASCLEPHNKHMVITSLTGLVSPRAGMCCKTEKNNFCIQCQTYLCSSCSKEHHSGHIVLSSFMDDSDVDKTIFCKGCESEKNLPIECLELTKKAFLCSSCYESGNRPEKRRKKGESEKYFIEDFKNKKREECQVHAVLGGDQHFVTNVYCLVCKLYMCMGCYKKHRRLYEYWSKYLEGNLFYCNRCPTAVEVNLKPVECYDLLSLEFTCGNCYTLKPKNGSNKTSYPQKIKSAMKMYTDTENQCTLHEDLPLNRLSSHTSSTANVFCLVCKEYMCKTCFRFHVDRNPNATRHPLSLLG